MSLNSDMVQKNEYQYFKHFINNLRSKKDCVQDIKKQITFLIGLSKIDFTSIGLKQDLEQILQTSNDTLNLNQLPIDVRYYFGSYYANQLEVTGKHDPKNTGNTSLVQLKRAYNKLEDSLRDDQICLRNLQRLAKELKSSGFVDIFSKIFTSEGEKITQDEKIILAISMIAFLGLIQGNTMTLEEILDALDVSKYAIINE